jgi:hypothetical protein
MPFNHMDRRFDTSTQATTHCDKRDLRLKTNFSCHILNHEWCSSELAAAMSVAFCCCFHADGLRNNRTATKVQTAQKQFCLYS